MGGRDMCAFTHMHTHTQHTRERERGGGEKQRTNLQKVEWLYVVEKHPFAQPL